MQNRRQSQNLKQFRSEIADAVSHEKGKCDSDAIRDYYQKILDDLQTRNTEFQREVVTLNESVADLQHSNQSLHAANSDLSQELEKCRLKAAALKLEMDRTKQVIKSEAQTLAFKHDFEIQNKIDECKCEFERSQRELIGFFALQFSSIVDLSEQLTQTNFRTVVQRLRAEFQRLLAQDRNVRLLLSLGPRESIEDAIARNLVMFDP
jgi:predicted RNase H-like nuclease (RuvC/YqgF family)